eukprot:scaffold7713_cov100-Isochrysis_galbana.AAC.3
MEGKGQSWFDNERGRARGVCRWRWRKGVHGSTAGGEGVAVHAEMEEGGEGGYHGSTPRWGWVQAGTLEESWAGSATARRKAGVPAARCFARPCLASRPPRVA